MEIPANTTASVFVPATNAGAVKESGKVLSQVNDIKVKDAVEGYVEVELGSGVYHFVVENMCK